MHPLVAAIIAGCGGGPPVQLTAAEYSNGIGEATLEFNTDGSLTVHSVLVTPTPPALDWYKGNPSTGIGSNWDVYAEVLSSTGDAPIGTFDTWLQISSQRDFTQPPPASPGGQASTIRFTLRPTGSGTGVVTADIILSAVTIEI